MSPTIKEQINQLNSTIAALEAQREVLGEAVVQKAVEPLREKLADLNHMLEAINTSPPERHPQQRKVLTILFMDIVGSTSIIQHMDPEDVSEIFDANLKKLAQPVENHGGRVTSFTGDGLMAIFGAQVAREDDPEHAVRAGLAILQIAEDLALELKKDWGIEDFKVRVGVNTGLVILGGETEGEDTTKGPAVHLAARLQGAAPPGGVLVSHNTYRHIRGVFDVEPWEPVKVKGFDEAILVYRIIRPRPRAFRTYTRGVEGVETHMVGRHDELKYLQDALLSAIEDGEGQVVTIIGDAGVGKSRLLYEFQNWIDLLPPPAVRFYEGRAHQEAQGIPYAMLRDLFEFRFQLQENDGRQAVREKVGTGFQEVFGEGDEGQMRAHILGHWLGFDFSTSPHLKGVVSDPEQVHNRGLMYLSEYFRGLCDLGPVVVFLEDIHWADDSSLDALNALGERLHPEGLLVVCASRHSLLERRPYWGEGLAYHHRLDLEPLSRRESHQLVGEILKLAGSVPPDLFDLVVEGAEGNPFYLEELIKMLVEEGVVIKGEEAWQVNPGRLSETKVPPTLAGVLQARLESLPLDEQRVLQQASVVGRLFWDRVVAHIQSVEGGKPRVVSDALSSLRSREMVFRREASAFTDAKEYLFKHDILREVTYESVLKRLRRRYHGLVAEWLISQVGERIGEYSGLIAGHLLQAGKNEMAGEYYLKAGKTALNTYANAEAEQYFRQALELPLVNNQQADCLSGLGVTLFKQGFKQDAIEAIRQSIELYLILEVWNSAAFMYALLASVLWIDDYEKAWNACQEGLMRLEEKAETPGLAYLLAQAGRAAHFCAKSTNEVINLCQRAIAMADRLGNFEARADASITIALRTADFDRAIDLLQEAATTSETNRIWYIASRAYTNLGAISANNIRSIEQIYQYHLKATEISLRIGDIEGLFFDLANLAENLIFQGMLNTMEDQLAEILRGSSAPQTRIQRFFDEETRRLLFPKGKWDEALGFYSHLLGEIRETGKYQFIANENINLAEVFLEIDYFTGTADLYEAETALRQNIELMWKDIQSYFLLVVVSARRKSFKEAHQRLLEARELVDHIIKGTSGPISKDSGEVEVYHHRAEAELARAEGRWDDAIDHFRALIELYQAVGYRWLWARYLIDLGDCLARRGSPGDREQAGTVYRQSLDMFTEMGAPGYIKVLEQRLGEKSNPG